MNPDSAIRPWLLTVGKQFGIRQAHDYEWEDAETRQREKYCTYKLSSMEESEQGNRDLSTSTGYTVNHRLIKEYFTDVVIDLYNSQNGLWELACFATAVVTPVIYQIFERENCSFQEVVELKTMPDSTKVEGKYHHRMVCTFSENVDVTVTESNAIVDNFVLNLDTDTPAYDVSSTGVEVVGEE